eukprot:GHVQ01024656.1.p1 GENE.GHVQ01024656.1~~GHVQ01024656.1.p1  ORF type:complete len:187 (+),score=22.41 GHVQ01024656.1:168-728(+)
MSVTELTHTKLRLGEGCVIPLTECSLSDDGGEISFGCGCALHPTCSIHCAPGSRLSIGDGCLIEERVTISLDIPNTLMTLGSHNWFRVGSEVRNVLHVGEWNIFSTKSLAYGGGSIGNSCYIGPLVSLAAPHLSDYSYLCLLDARTLTTYPDTSQQERQRQAIRAELEAAARVLRYTYPLRPTTPA